MSISNGSDRSVGPGGSAGSDAPAAPPTIGVLLCDHIVDHLQGCAGGDYDSVFGAWLGAVGLRTRTYAVVDGEFPESVDACDGWVISGSRCSANGEEPWIDRLCEFVVAAHDAEARVFGICFGHQVIARALGGRVESGTGWRVGPHRLNVEATPWFDAQEVWLNVMHQDEVVELPDAARLVGSGTTAAIGAFAVGDHMLCFQDHPEFTPAYTRALIETRASLLGEEIAAPALTELDRRTTNGPEVATWAKRFLTTPQADWSRRRDQS